jgi:hypothetical protein
LHQRIYWERFAHHDKLPIVSRQVRHQVCESVVVIKVFDLYAVASNNQPSEEVGGVCGNQRQYGVIPYVVELEL